MKMTPKQKFDFNLKQGQKEELILVEKLKAILHEGKPRYEVFHSIDNGKFNDYDIKIIDLVLNKTITIELKTDMDHQATGNIAIETGKITPNGIIPSGIFNTKADWFVYKLIEFPGYWFLPTQDFIRYINENRTTPVGGKPGGDYDKFMIELIRRDPFMQVAMELTRTLPGMEKEYFEKKDPKQF